MDNKKLMMGLGIIGVGAIAYYLYMKSKNKKGTMTLPTTTTANFANLVIDMGEDSNDDGDNMVEIVDQYSGARTNIILE